jgi:hypothetical protein
MERITYRHKCIKSFSKWNSENIICEKGKWYEIYNATSFRVVIFGSGAYDSWAVSQNEVRGHFLTEQEVREKEINKILNEV